MYPHDQKIVGSFDHLRVQHSTNLVVMPLLEAGPSLQLPKLYGLLVEQDLQFVKIWGILAVGERPNAYLWSALCHLVLQAQWYHC